LQVFCQSELRRITGNTPSVCVDLIFLHGCIPSVLLCVHPNVYCHMPQHFVPLCQKLRVNPKAWYQCVTTFITCLGLLTAMYVLFCQHPPTITSSSEPAPCPACTCLDYIPPAQLCSFACLLTLSPSCSATAMKGFHPGVCRQVIAAHRDFLALALDGMLLSRPKILRLVVGLEQLSQTFSGVISQQFEQLEELELEEERLRNSLGG
jgi:hypothetical protein